MHIKLTVCLVGLMAQAGCGLISSDVTDFTLSLPEHKVTVDTADWKLAAMDEMPAVDCGGNEGVCSDGVSQYCGADGVCFGACGAEQTCEVTVVVALWQKVDLAAESPELMSINDEPLVSVTVDHIQYSVIENTLNVASPELTVYAAPQSIMSPGDPLAQEIGTIAPIQPGETVTDRDIDLTADGQATLASFMQDYHTPFNLIVGSEVLIQAGDPMPTGHLVAGVKATAHAGL